MRRPRLMGSKLYPWAVVGLITLGVVINYLSRNTLSVLAAQLEVTLRFGVREYSYIVAAFQLAYTVMQPVCGYVLDRLGVRLGFALFALLWSGAGLAHALAGGWQALALCRAGLGASEAAAVPGGMKAISEWFKGPNRSQAVGWFNVGTSFGAMLAPPLTVGLTLIFGWRSGFLATGVMGVIWAMGWYWLYRSPTDAPAAAAIRVPLTQVLGQRRFWALAIPRFLAEPAWQTFTFWIPLYLASERHWDLQHIAIFAWTPFLAADLGGVAGGYLSPWLGRRFHFSLLRSRQTVVGLAAVLMIAPGLIGLVADANIAILLFCVGGFAHQMISVTLNTLSADLFASERLAVANGWVGSAGWTGGLLFSLLIGQIAHAVGFAPLFGCLGIFDLIGVVILVGLLRGVRPLEESA